MNKIEAHGNLKKETVNDPAKRGADYFMLELVGDASQAQANKAFIKCKSIQNSSMVLHKGQPYSLMELVKDKYLVDDLIIYQWQVISRMDKAARMDMLDPIKLPHFNIDTFPFLMVRDTYHNFYLANVRESTTQVLVLAN